MYFGNTHRTTNLNHRPKHCHVAEGTFNYIKLVVDAKLSLGGDIEDYFSEEEIATIAKSMTMARIQNANERHKINDKSGISNRE